MYIPSASRLRAAENLRKVLFGGNAELVGLALRLSLAHRVQRWSIASVMLRTNTSINQTTFKIIVDLDPELQ